MKELIFVQCVCAHNVCTLYTIKLVCMYGCMYAFKYVVFMISLSCLYLLCGDGTNIVFSFTPQSLASLDLMLFMEIRRQL